MREWLVFLIEQDVSSTKKKANFAETKQVLVKVAEDRASHTKNSVQVSLSSFENVAYGL